MHHHGLLIFEVQRTLRAAHACRPRMAASHTGAPQRCNVKPIVIMGGLVEPSH